MKIEDKIKNLISKCEENMNSIDTEIEKLDQQITESKDKKRKGKTLQDKLYWENETNVLIKARTQFRRNYYDLQDGFQVETFQEIKLLIK